MTDRAARRHCDQVQKARARFWFARIIHVSELLTPFWVGRRAATRKPCSWSCCGNPRKWFKHKDRDELLSLLAEKEQVRELSAPK